MTTQRRIFITVFGAYIAVAVLGCKEEDNNDDTETTTDSITDTDTDTDTVTDNEECTDEYETDEYGINCQGGPLFAYGIASITSYAVDATTGEFSKSSYFAYGYNDAKQRSSATASIWSGGELIVNYERTYTYDVDGALLNMEWVRDSTIYRRIYAYDQEGRVSSETMQTESNSTVTEFSKTTFEYGADGRPMRLLYESTQQRFGILFEYDEAGRVAKRTYLDADTGWSETDAYTEYRYDCLGRLAGKIEVNPETTGTTETACSYVGHTARLSQCISENNGVTTVEVYTRDAESLTVTMKEIANNIETILLEDVYTFNTSVDSSFDEIFPLPFYEWPKYSYGYGLLNGCQGLALE